jgi:hypothetical protein
MEGGFCTGSLLKPLVRSFPFWIYLGLDIQFDLPRAPELLGAGDAFPNVRPPTFPQDSETLGHSKSKACGGGGLKEKPNTDSLTKERDSRRESKTNLFSLRVRDVSMFVS